MKPSALPNVEHALVGADDTGHLPMTTGAALLESVTVSSVSKNRP